MVSAVMRRLGRDHPPPSAAVSYWGRARERQGFQACVKEAISVAGGYLEDPKTSMGQSYQSSAPPVFSF